MIVLAMSSDVESIIQKSFFQSPAGMVLERLRDQRIVAVNQSFERITGFASERAIGTEMSQLGLWVSEQARERIVQSLLEGKTVSLKEQPFNTRSGLARIFLYSAVLIEDGREQYIFATFHDITVRKLAEALQQEAEQTLRTLMNANPQPNILIGANTVVLAANKAAVRLFGREGESLSGIKFLDLFPSSEAEQRMDIFRRVAKTREALRFEDTVGHSTLDVYVAPVLKSGGGIIGFAICAVDITERRRMELEREELIAKLQTALAEVKTLSGLLPICANCKKIRDGQNQWQQLEVYVTNHSQASFSHGICPECMEKLYGNEMK